MGRAGKTWGTEQAPQKTLPSREPSRISPAPHSCISLVKVTRWLPVSPKEAEPCDQLLPLSDTNGGLCGSQSKLKNVGMQTGETAQWVKALASKPDNRSPIFQVSHVRKMKSE